MKLNIMLKDECVHQSLNHNGNIPELNTSIYIEGQSRHYIVKKVEQYFCGCTYEVTIQVELINP